MVPLKVRAAASNRPTRAYAPNFMPVGGYDSNRIGRSRVSPDGKYVTCTRRTKLTVLAPSGIVCGKNLIMPVNQPFER
jgi:hypothetical protein